MAKKAGSSRCLARCLPEWDVHGQWNWSAEAIIGQGRSGFCSKPGLLQHRELLLPRVCIRHCSTLFIQFQNWVFSGCQAWSMHSTAECHHCADSRVRVSTKPCVWGAGGQAQQRQPEVRATCGAAVRPFPLPLTLGSPVGRRTAPGAASKPFLPEIGTPELPFPW